MTMAGVTEAVHTEPPASTAHSSPASYGATRPCPLQALARPFRTHLDLGNRGAFSAHNAVELGKLSKRAYEESTLAAGYVQFLHQENATHQIVAFAGTYGTKDWLESMASAKAERHGMGRVHAGFSEAFDSVAEGLKLLVPGKPVVPTGHGLGGAVATLAALHLRQKGHDVHSVYTFGAPRVGDGGFQEAYGKAGIPTYRVVNAFDKVPRIRKNGFHHVGQPVYLSREGRRLDRQESAWTLWPWQIPGQRASCHAMDRYLDTLREFVS